VTITRTGGFTGLVTLTIDRASPDVVASPTSVELPAVISEQHLTFAASATAALGNYSFEVRATGQGIEPRTARVTVGVSQVGGFVLHLEPPDVSAEPGSRAATTVTIVRSGGFAGAVRLAADPLSLVTAASTPTLVTGSAATLTVDASESLVPDNYPLTVRGTATGMPDRTAVLTLDVAPVGVGAPVSWDFCSADRLPLWFAYQSGYGHWRRGSRTGTRFDFDLHSGRGGVAVVLRDAYDPWPAPPRVAIGSPNGRVVGPALAVFYETVAELNSVGACEAAAPVGAATKRVTGTVAGVGPRQVASITLGPAQASISGNSTDRTFLLTVPDGALDLIARHSIDNRPDKLIIRRGISVAHGGSSRPSTSPATRRSTPSSGTSRRPSTPLAPSGMRPVSMEGAPSPSLIQNPRRPVLPDLTTPSPRTGWHPVILTRALAANRRAAAFFETIDAANRYAILYRVQTAKKPETRAERIAKFVAMLSRHETIHPQRRRN